MNARPPLSDCQTLMLDMDGTLLDLAYDNYMWLTHIPAAYAERHGLDPDAARERLFKHYRRLAGDIDWYCLDHWSERLGLDVLGLHRDERERIGWLPGARDFLQAIADADGSRPRVLLVTNSHRDTLALKAQETGIDRYFDAMHTAHDFGYSKERREFWEALAEAEHFNPHTTLFIDDTERVLASAAGYGIGSLLKVTRPDTSRAAADRGAFDGIDGVARLLG